ncbi:uncharacterized protein LOC105255519 [Camponotus floridanus]|uniref:uncharacterized protein LOC105255519 n=1 Tax=Camponotus floridanus TaxID=104421 RepID=UPI000DC6B74B|nr:uncharacterized protein LOC105255519 [Camponotus floridanus]
MPKKESTIIVEDDETVNRVAVRTPPFWPEDPELWFAQLEGQFTLGAITDDDVRYGYVLSKLEPRQAREIKDVITNLPSNKYSAIKHALIQRLTDSQEQRIRQLLEKEELGDRKPSQFLRHLSTLAGTTVSDDLLWTLCLGRLPPQTQAILATRKGDKLQDVAEQADHIHEIDSRALVLATDHRPAAAAAATSSQNTLTTQMEALTLQVATLTERLTNMAKELRRGRSRARSRSRGKPRSRTPAKEGLCYYHRRFGAEAHRCAQPYRNTRTKYLVDTGSDVSVYPQTTVNGKRRPEAYELFAANGTPIITYGFITIKPDFNLRRAFPEIRSSRRGTANNRSTSWHITISFRT